MNNRIVLPTDRGAEGGATILDLVERARTTSRVPLPDRTERSPELTALALAAIGAGIRYWASRPAGDLVVDTKATRGARRADVVVVPGMYAPPASVPVGDRGRRPRRWIRRSLVLATVAVGYSKVRRILDDNDQAGSGAYVPR